MLLTHLFQADDYITFFSWISYPLSIGFTQSGTDNVADSSGNPYQGELIRLDKLDYFAHDSAIIITDGKTKEIPRAFSPTFLEKYASKASYHTNDTYLKRIDHSEKNFNIFLRVQNDIVSNEIKVSDSWKNCDDLSFLWSTTLRYGPGIFIDVGANIGFCSFFLASTGVEVIAFEPQPDNLYYFTQSLLKNKPEVSARIWLFPYGLGDSSKTVSAYTQPGNFGNTVLEL
jgi:hypothetical protein